MALSAAIAPAADFAELALDTSAYDPTRILVRFKPDAPEALLAGAAACDPQLVPGLREVPLDPNADVAAVLRAYKESPHVLYAEPDFRVQLRAVPVDPQFGSLWGMHNTSQTGGLADADIDAPEAWDVTTGSGNTIVAVIDTGVDYTHPDLAANIWTNTDEIAGNGLDDDNNGYIDDRHGYDFVNNDGDPRDDHFHGTHVAGTIGAHGNNGVGVTGVNWQVQIMALKFLDASGGGFLSDAIAALNYAVANGATISNNSWGGGGYSQALFNAIEAAGNAGHIYVAAAGNDGSDNDVFPAYPASYDLPNIISVAATDHFDELAYFSNFGAASVDLGAPGDSIRSTFPTYTTGAMQGSGFARNYETISGTSMATPHVAGVVALVRDQHPQWTSSQVINQVLLTVDVVPALGATVSGGRLNAAAAVGNPAPDERGPRVTSSTPAGAVSGTIGSISFTFSEPIADGSFTLADVASFSGPGGVDLLDQISGISGSGRNFTVSFTPQSALGSYQMMIGPDIFDQSLQANPMDQDGDGAPGEIPDDHYTASFVISEVLIFNATDVPAPIYDFTATGSFLNIDQDVVIGDLNVQLNITHTYDGDLQFYLISPNDPYNYVLLSQFRGGAGQNFAGTIFDDEAGTPIGAGSAPFSGAFQPETPLAAFQGQNARGTWELWIEDWGFFDVGTLNSWSLLIQPGDGSPPPPPPPGENQPPYAQDDYATTDEDTPVTFSVLDNDYDPDADPLTIVSISDVLHGTAVLNADGTVTFTPDPDFNYYIDVAGFNYSVSDGRGETATAFAWIDVLPANDPPVAVDDQVVGERNKPLAFNYYDGITINLEQNDLDIDGDGLWITAVGNPQHGTVVMEDWGGITFTPAAGYLGLASFEYTVTDGVESDTGLVQINVKEFFYFSTTAGGSLTNSDGTSLAFTNADIVQLSVEANGQHTYRMYFDGSDVGLSTANEDIDAFAILPDGSILISTLGSFTVPQAWGGNYSGGGVDLLQFWPDSLGANTSGWWDFYFDGSNVGLSGTAENIDAVARLEDGRILISTAGSYAVPGVPSGTNADEDLLAFTPWSQGLNATAGEWSLYFDGSDVGLANTAGEDVDALFVQESTSGGLPTLHFSTRDAFSVPGLSGENEDAFAFRPTRLGGTTTGSYGPGLALDGSLYGLAAFDIDGFHRGWAPNHHLMSLAQSTQSAGLRAGKFQALALEDGASSLRVTAKSEALAPAFSRFSSDALLGEALSAQRDVSVAELSAADDLLVSRLPARVYQAAVATSSAASVPSHRPKSAGLTYEWATAAEASHFIDRIFALHGEGAGDLVPTIAVSLLLE